MMTTKQAALSLAIAALLAPPVLAQANLATLTGVVTDSGGGVVPEAEATLINTGTGITKEQSTGASGSYTFTALIPGQYDLIITSDGF
ncbi:MAG: carboxypeptidase-like regulatory domain-containing protein, partial [Bryobacterales bacterium]|nr:carboxypeptidase-like regulatory domain-containing protein [Bryobacterales bacterium]